MFNEKVFQELTEKVGPDWGVINLRGMARRLEVSIDDVLGVVNSLVKVGLIYKIDAVEKGCSGNVFRMPRGMLDDYEN
ncbi:hypothetical protein [Glutamicibacter arilaitensis]|uniref:hypothetical protein n=1 Tax=Glutamicibacter arilaitensis TaxID=256701 RepID=UPI003F904557